VASGPVDTGNLPGNNCGKLQGLALELRHTAQIDSVVQTDLSAILFSIFATIAGGLASGFFVLLPVQLKIL
jgi:hypothetical protein